MINFELNKYEWQKQMKTIMENVNLSGINISNDKSFAFIFLDSIKGEHYKDIICTNVWKFIYDSSLEVNEEWPIFVGEVKVIELQKQEIEEAFKYFNYSFNIPNYEKYLCVCIESGELSIALLCEDMKLTK